MPRPMPCLAAALALLPVAAPVTAGAGDAACRARAERLSGYRPALIEGQAGKLKYRLGGSVALGGSRSSGPPLPDPPPFAGSAHRERLEADRTRSRAELYRRVYDACIGEGRE